jgi:hypothetical protein
MDEKMSIEALISDMGGALESIGVLPDGSGWATASFPLPKNHWIYEPTGEPPTPFIVGTDPAELKFGMTRAEWVERVRAAGKYAVKASTMSGKEMDFDPDAMLQNLVVGLLGYWTPSGVSTL